MLEYKDAKVCHSKGMVLFVSVLSHASVTPNFKHGKLVHAHNWLKQVPWWLDVKRPSYSCFVHGTLMWISYSPITLTLDSIKLQTSPFHFNTNQKCTNPYNGNANPVIQYYVPGNMSCDLLFFTQSGLSVYASLSMTHLHLLLEICISGVNPRATSTTSPLAYALDSLLPK